MSKRSNFVPSGRYLIGMGSEIRLIFLFLSYFKNKACFKNCLWGTSKPSMLFYVGFLFGRRTSVFEIKDLTWSNMEQISSRSVLWYIFLLRRLMLKLDFSYVVWCKFCSSSAPWSVIGSSPFISMIHTFRLAYVGGLWTSGDFGIVSGI